ncbi:MAG: sugar ABC transporter ATP-binding protein [Deltaproteobacteria bacterium]|nr:sugar ABC transporter ATP-binding protein [Deltaproteobacteria bacterium]
MSLVLELKNISKSYNGNPVLKGISFALQKGEVRAVIGENGAGKSTLMNIIFGMPVIHQSGGFEGECLIDGHVVNFQKPQHAMAAGLGMVHQEFMLIPGLKVSENIKLNREPLSSKSFNRFLPGKLKVIDNEQIHKDSLKALQKVGMDLDPDQLIKGLSVGHLQFIEIAREVDHQNLKVLVFDEPTAVLTESEASQLLNTIRHLAKDLGIAVLFISHRLDEVKEIADTVTVLRDGELIGNYRCEDLDKKEMARLMVGRAVNIRRDQEQESPNARQNIMTLKNFSVRMPGENLQDIDLEIKQGEILGIGGLAGQGKLGLANGIAGLMPASGNVIFEGQAFSLNDPKQALQNGLGFLSEDRKQTGLLLDESITHNICFTASHVLGRFQNRFGLFDQKQGKEWAQKMIKDFDIRCTGPEQHTRRLSGGNQQKVCLARVITANPKLLFVSEPTRGVDIGAKKIILDFLRSLNQQGVTVVLTSSELSELRVLCDRIAIVASGKISEILLPEDSDERFGLAMAA